LFNVSVSTLIELYILYIENRKRGEFFQYIFVASRVALACLNFLIRSVRAGAT
jgi:hypothetical protein